MTRQEASEYYHSPIETLDETLYAMGLMYDEELQEVVDFDNWVIRAVS
mgnify:FL=1